MGKKIQAINARQSAAFLNMDGSIGGHEFVGRHARVTDDNQSGPWVPGSKILHFLGLIASRRILPHKIVNGIVKEEDLQILELRPGVIEQRLDEFTYGSIDHPPLSIIRIT